jgi:hypothetical protein
MFEVTNDVSRRTITARMSGFMRPNEMKEYVAVYKKATDSYGGGRHLVLADMRGLRPLEPESANLFSEVINHGRKNGCVMCAHVSDSTIARLQTARVASEASPNDDITVDCVSLEEAQNQLAKARVRLLNGENMAAAGR